MSAVVIDTNITLDLFVFQDPAIGPLREALEIESLDWLATDGMRGELVRVLAYPQIVRKLIAVALSENMVLDAFDRHVRIVPAAAKAPFTCKDPDDQVFIDLAAAHGATLLSKDAEVLCMARRLERLGVRVCRAWTVTSITTSHLD